MVAPRLGVMVLFLALALLTAPLTGDAQQPGRVYRVELGLKHERPTMFGPREHVEAGGLLSDSPDRADLYRRAASYAGKIPMGASPADLPVPRATRVGLVLNLTTMKALGPAILQSALLRVDQIIQ